MEFDLSNNKIIYNLLLNIIPVPDICEKIISFKNTIEQKEAYDYHVERWETISSLYFRSLENYHPDIIIYSYMFNRTKQNEYITEPDRNTKFFNETGISYQVRNLLLELFNCPNDYNKGMWKNMILFDDKLYGKISKEIMLHMKST